MIALITQKGVQLSYVKETRLGSEFATHKVGYTGEGLKKLVWGHYFTDFDTAKADFKKRQQ